MEDIVIRPLRDWDEYHEAVRMQQLFWGDSDESVVPAHMLHSLTCYGGHILGAFDGARMVGIVIGFLGTNIEEPDRPAMANLLIASKRAFVLPEYRGRGIAYRLKLAQRDLAIRQGIRLIEWTYDPIMATNAHFNIRKLNVICQKFVPNYYGTEPNYSVLGTSDRLVAEWWITNRRVEERLKGRRNELTLKHYLEAETRMVNPTESDSNGNPTPAAEVNTPTGSLALLEIPAHFDRILALDESLARTWRAHIRDMFNYLFGRGYIVTDFLFENVDGRERAFYVLSWNYGSQFFGIRSRTDTFRESLT